MLLYLPMILGVLINLLSVYFIAVALLGLKKPAPYPDAAPACRFAVVIPARNEEAVVASLVDSLKNQDYPESMYDIYVAPNNCTDDTAGAARRAGAKILDCPYPVHCKGDVLRQVSTMLLARDYDVFCVFDADNLAHRHFLREMNNAFSAGVRVAKGRTVARNPSDSWVSRCYDLYFGFFDLFFNRPRASCGLSAKLVGTGFAVHRSVLEEFRGWDTQTLAEDAEFSAQCAAAGCRVAWVPKAVTYDEQPVSFRLSLTQRLRWCSGVMQVACKTLPALRTALSSRNRLLALDFILFLLMPFARALSLLTLLLSLLFAALSGIPALLQLLQVILSASLFSYAGTSVLAAFIVLITRRGGIGMWRGILLFPLFMASWVPLQVISLFRRTTVWAEIRHTGGSVQKKTA